MPAGSGKLRRYSPAIALLTRLLDPLLCIVAGFLAYDSRFASLATPLTLPYMELIALAALLVLAVFPALGVYQSWRSRGWLVPAGRTLLAWIVVFLLLMLFLVGLKQSEAFSRLWLLAWLGWSALLMVAARAGAYAVLRAVRRRGFNTRSLVIVGGAAQIQALVARVRAADWSGLQIAALFVNNGNSHEIEHIVAQPLAAMAGFVNSRQVDEVWIALSLEESSKLRKILEQLRNCTANVRYVPDFFGMFLLNQGVTDMLSVPMIDLSATPMMGMNRLAKAIEDRVLAAVILIFISPLMLVIALGVKLGSRGPVFYRQERVGWNGRPFRMLKFRSMRKDAESATGAMWANRNDDRTTAFGRFIRRTSLDELPQFINVLTGDMSIVGPRPERPVFVEQFKQEIPGYMQKHVVKAGITGWAQINGWRGRTDLHRRIEHDLYYIEHWTLWLDIKIIVLTVFKGFVNRNAY